MWGFIRGLLVVVGVVTALTIGEMILDTLDQNAPSAAHVQIVSR